MISLALFVALVGIPGSVQANEPIAPEVGDQVGYEHHYESGYLRVHYFDVSDYTYINSTPTHNWTNKSYPEYESGDHDFIQKAEYGRNNWDEVDDGYVFMNLVIGGTGQNAQRVEGFIENPFDYDVKIWVESDDGIELTIGQEPVEDYRASKYCQTDFITLPANSRLPLRMLYFNWGGDGHLFMYYTTTTRSEATVVPASWFSYYSGATEIPAPDLTSFELEGVDLVSTNINLDTNIVDIVIPAEAEGMTFTAQIEPSSLRSNVIVAGHYLDLEDIDFSVPVYLIIFNDSSGYATYQINAVKEAGPVEYTVTFDPVGGTFADGITDLKTLETVNGRLSEIPVVTKAGFTFDGFFRNNNELVTTTTVFTTDETITAQFTEIVVPPPTPPPTPNPTSSSDEVRVRLDSSLVVLQYGDGADEEAASHRFTATVSNSSYRAVEWEIDSNEYLEISQSGVVSFKKVPEGPIEEFSATVTVRSLADKRKEDTAEVLIEEVVPLGIVEFYEPYISGYPEGFFKPEQAVTRAEVATMFARILNLELDKSSTQIYDDVNQGEWFYEYINAVEAISLFDDSAEDNFRPNDMITRVEMVLVFSRYWQHEQIIVLDDPLTIVDVPHDYYAASEIYAAYHTGLFQGYDDGTFRPENPLLRQEVVALINKLIGRPEYLPETSKFLDVDKDHWAYGHIEAASQAFPK